MTSRAEVTTKYAQSYAKTPKKVKGRVLDVVTKKPPKPRAPKHSFDRLKVL